MDLPCSECKTECLSELLGTYLLILLGPASIIIVALSRIQPVPAALFVAFSFGGTVGLVILVGGKYSDPYVNPAVTVAAAVARELRSNLFLRYVCFQLTGGVLAGFTLRVFFGQADSTSLGSTKLAQGFSPSLGIVLEAAGTLLLALSALIASSQVKGPWKQSLLVGTTLFTLILLVGPFTGAGFNPARSLGPSLASGYLVDQYVYWAGPLSGAVIAGLIFKTFGRRHRGKRVEAHPVCLC